MDVEARVHHHEVQVEDLGELQKRLAESVDVHLKDVREVNEEVRRFLLATDCVQHSGNNVHLSSSIDKVPLQGQGVQALSTVDEIGREAERGSNLSDISSCVG
jgi:hypothetical protein